MIIIKKNLSPIIVAIIFVVLITTSFYFYSKYKSTKKILDNPTTQAKNDKEKLIKEVGTLIDLPNEEPTLATVTNKEKLKSQPFFAKTENGDRVLIYTKAKKAILYRPSINKIIEVSKINLETSSPTSTITPTKIVELSSPTVTPTVVNKVKLVIYNGTKVTNLATKEKDLILSKTNNIEVTALGNSKNDYTENLVISLKTGNENAAKQLADLVSGKVVTLPKGETAPADANLLLIVGKE